MFPGAEIPTSGFVGKDEVPILAATLAAHLFIRKMLTLSLNDTLVDTHMRQKFVSPRETAVLAALQAPITDKRRVSERVKEAASGETQSDKGKAKKAKGGDGKAAGQKKTTGKGSGGDVLTVSQLKAFATSDRGLLVQDVEAFEKGGALCFAWGHWSKAVDPTVVHVAWCVASAAFAARLSLLCVFS